MSSYYDEEFRPWEIVDGQCVVTDEAEWQKLVDLDRAPSCRDCCDSGFHGTCECKNSRRPIVKVPTDIFEDVKGSVFDSKFRHVFNLESESVKPHDLFVETFQTIGSTPNVDYLLMTRHPELVRDKWQCESETVTEQLIGRAEKHSVELKRHFKIMPNVILAVPVETQADIERLVPELEKCRDLCKGLAAIANPKEELDFMSAGPMCQLSGADPNAGIPSDSLGLDLVIVEGNEHPLHPDWVRSLRDQCLDANVPFNFASWGHWHESYLTTNGRESFKFDDGVRMCHFESSESRLLDGKEHNGRVS